MMFICPGCGKKYDISAFPETERFFRCTQAGCSRVFTMDDVKFVPRASVPAAGEEEEPPAGGDQDTIRALAQDYFSDLPAADAPAAPEPAIESKTEFQEEASPEMAELQWQQLLQLAREPRKEGPDADALTVGKSRKRREKIKRAPKAAPVREKKRQRPLCGLLLLALAAIFLARILITGMMAGEPHFNRMQPQIIPSALYFAAAFILTIRLTRFTARPQWLAAALLPLPLILDAWYLMDGLAPGAWFAVSSGAKLLFSLNALWASFRAAGHPAKAYRGPGPEK